MSVGVFDVRPELQKENEILSYLFKSWVYDSYDYIEHTSR